MKTDLVGRGWAFPPHVDARGRVALTSERSELEQAIQIVLMTPLGQRVMRPTFGCRIHDLVFAPVNNQTLAQARRYVTEALAMWEPRITVTEVEVRPAYMEDRTMGTGATDAFERKRGRNSVLLIEIQYKVKATHDQRSLVYPFYLIP